MYIIDPTKLDKNPVQAKTAKNDVSSKYGFVSSENVLSAFAGAGWEPVSQQALATRDESRKGFQKHLIRLENQNYLEIPGLTGNAASRPQLVFINSHDRASSMRLVWGMFRMVCLNGCIAGQAVGEIRLNHSANVLQRLPLAIDNMLTGFPKLIEQSTAMASKQLSGAEINHLVKTVYDARLDNVKKLVNVDYTLPVLRSGDMGNDAFTVYNRVQEMVIRGGIKYTYLRSQSDDGVTQEYPLTSVTRKVGAIEQSVKLNQLAYETTLSML